MKNVAVRCWEFKNYCASGKSNVLYLTYPEDNYGHELITCLRCGKIYAVTVALKVYVGPTLREKLKEIKCIECGNNLGDNYSSYPDKYVVEGKIFTYKKPTEIPSEEESIVKEFPGIYDN